LSCVLGLTVAFAAACSSSPSTGSKTSSSTAGLPKAEVKDLAIIGHLQKDSAIANMLPAKYRGATLKVATDATYAPDEFESTNQTIIGWDPEMGSALAKVLGVKFQFVNTAFDSIIPGLQASRYNMAMSSMGPFPYRAKVVDFVTDFKAGLALHDQVRQQYRSHDRPTFAVRAHRGSRDRQHRGARRLESAEKVPELET
jgi:polar amino acid transport system substrate-binding protein